MYFCRVEVENFCFCFVHNGLFVISLGGSSVSYTVDLFFISLGGKPMQNKNLQVRG